MPDWRSTPEGVGADWKLPEEWASAAAIKKFTGLVGAVTPWALSISGGRIGACGITGLLGSWSLVCSAEERNQCQGRSAWWIYSSASFPLGLARRLAGVWVRRGRIGLAGVCLGSLGCLTYIFAKIKSSLYDLDSNFDHSNAFITTLT